MMRIAYVTTCSPLAPTSGHALRVHANWRVMGRLGEVRVWAFGSSPPLPARQLQRAAGIVPLPGRAERVPARVVRHLRAFAAGRSMLYAKAMSPRRLERLRQSLLAWEPDLLVVGDTWLADLLPVLKGTARRTVVDTHNAESRLYRRIVAEQGYLRKLKFELFRRNALRLERRFAEADLVMATSGADADFYREERGLPHVVVLPNGIDVDAYAPLDLPVEPGSIVFTGAYGYWPNEAAAMHLVRLSRALEERGVEHRVLLVGRDPTPAMLQAASTAPRVTVTGAVDDVRPYIARAALCVAPLTSGSGTKYKILEALALGKPVVTTPLGTEGLDLVDGEQVAVVRDLDELPGRVARLLGDPEARARMASRGRGWVIAHHSFDSLERTFRMFLDRLSLSGRPAPRSRAA